MFRCSIAPANTDKRQFKFKFYWCKISKPEWYANMREIWSVDFKENIYNCCHQMSSFKAKMHQIRFRLGLRPRPRWGSLQRSPRLPSWISGGLLLGGGRGLPRGPRVSSYATGKDTLAPVVWTLWGERTRRPSVPTSDAVEKKSELMLRPLSTLATHIPQRSARKVRSSNFSTLNIQALGYVSSRTVL